MARPSLTALGTSDPDLYIGERLAREIAPGPPDHTCVACGVFGASFGFKRTGWAHNRAEAVWSCGDADCRAEAQAKAISSSRAAA